MEWAVCCRLLVARSSLRLTRIRFTNNGNVLSSSQLGGVGLERSVLLISVHYSTHSLPLIVGPAFRHVGAMVVKEVSERLYWETRGRSLTSPESGWNFPLGPKQDEGGQMWQ